MKNITRFLSLALALLLAVGLAVPAFAARPGAKRQEAATRPANARAALFGAASQSGFSAEIVRTAQVEIAASSTGEDGLTIHGKDRVTLTVSRESGAAAGWKAVYKVGDGAEQTTPPATGESLSFNVEITLPLRVTLLRITDGEGRTVGESGKFIELNKLTAHKLSYNAGGGTGTLPADQTGSLVIVGSGDTLSRDGYKFSHWGTQPEGGTRYNPGAAALLTADVTLYAQWEKVKQSFTLSYDASGGTGEPKAATATEGDEITVAPQGAMTREGYSFTGWNTRKDGSGSKTAAGDKLNLSENITLYAQWEKVQKSFTLSYDASGGTGEPKAATATEGDEITVAPQGAMTREGYSFTGWNTRKDGSGSKAAAGDKLNLSENITLYAQWEAVKKAPEVVLTGLDKDDNIEVKKGGTVDLTKLVKAESGVSYKFYTRTTSFLRTVQYREIANPAAYKPTGPETIFVQATNADGATSDYESFGVVLNGTALTLVSITPANNAENIAVNLDKILLTFSETAGIAKADGITLKDSDETTVAIGKTASESTVTLTIGSLLKYNTSYTLSIAEDAITYYTGGTFDFKTEAKPTYTTAPSGSSVSTTAAVKITFNKAVHLSTGKSLSDITIKKSGDSSNIATGRSFSEENKAITLTHGTFAPSTNYIVTIPGGTLHGFDSDISYTFKTTAGSNVPVYSGPGPEADSGGNYLIEQMAKAAYNNLYVDVLEAKSGATVKFNATVHSEIPFWVIDELAGDKIKLEITYSDGSTTRTATIDCSRIPKTAKHRIFFRAADLVKLYA